MPPAASSSGRHGAVEDLARSSSTPPASASRPSACASATRSASSWSARRGAPPSHGPASDASSVSRRGQTSRSRTSRRRTGFASDLGARRSGRPNRPATAPARRRWPPPSPAAPAATSRSSRRAARNGVEWDARNTVWMTGWAEVVCAALDAPDHGMRRCTRRSAPSRPTRRPKSASNRRRRTAGCSGRRRPLPAPVLPMPGLFAAGTASPR